MKNKLTSDIPPPKIRYHHIVHDLNVLLNESREKEIEDFKDVHAFLAQHYGLSEEDLLLQGIRRAYRQIIEGV